MAAGTLALWLELLVREAAVYVIVMMLPLAFAALVWPARRAWAIRAVELLVALILSKFAIVAVLSLGGAALSHSAGGVSFGGAMAGFALIVMGAFAPWALLRLLPLHELAAGAAGSLRGELRSGSVAATDHALGRAGDAHYGWGSDWAGSLTAGMRRQAQEAEPSTNGAAAEHGRLLELGGVDSGAMGRASEPASADSAGPGAEAVAGSGHPEPASDPGPAAEPVFRPGPVITLGIDKNWRPSRSRAGQSPSEDPDPPEPDSEPPVPGPDPLAPGPEPEDGRL
jgi:hypothetical protein